MAVIKNEIASMEAEEFAKNNGIIARTICTLFKRGWFAVKDLCNGIAAYGIKLDDVLEAVDYFQDRGFLEVRDADTKQTVLACDADYDEIEMRLTADGKLMGYQLLSDKGISL